RLDGQPDLDRPAGAGELEAAIGEVHAAAGPEVLLEVFRVELEGSLEGGAVTDQQAPDLERHREPLVRIERDRVREREPFEGRATAFGEHGEGAVRPVDMEPRATGVA